MAPGVEEIYLGTTEEICEFLTLISNNIPHIIATATSHIAVVSEFIINNNLCGDLAPIIVSYLENQISDAQTTLLKIREILQILLNNNTRQERLDAYIFARDIFDKNIFYKITISKHLSWIQYCTSYLRSIRSLGHSILEDTDEGLSNRGLTEQNLTRIISNRTINAALNVPLNTGNLSSASITDMKYEINSEFIGKFSSLIKYAPGISSTFPNELTRITQLLKLQDVEISETKKINELTDIFAKISKYAINQLMPDLLDAVASLYGGHPLMIFRKIT